MAFSIGTAPGVQYVGDFKAGESAYVKFYLMTNANSDVLVQMSYTKPHIEAYYPGGFRFVSAEQTSQEDISGWIKFQQNPVLVSPRKSFLVTFENGETIRANAEAVYKLTIPSNAEPGYHIGSISLSPKVASGGAGAGVSTIGVTRYLFVFKVRGVAERKGEVVNIYADRIDKKKARIDVIYKNTGQNTVSVWVDRLNIYDEYGGLNASLNSGMVYVAPGEMKIIPVYWTADSVPSGQFRAEAKVNYITGYAAKSVSIDIPLVPSKAISAEIPKDRFPWWLIVLAALLIILIIYWIY
jgi:hypothetical protein